jgi:hypothetical protein
MLIASLCCGIVPFIAGFVIYFNAAKNKNFHSSAVPIALTASVVPPLLISLYIFYSLVTSYNGLCEGPPDYSEVCTFAEYMTYHLFSSIEVFGYALLCVLSMGWAGVVFGIIGYYFSKHENPNS